MQVTVPEAARILGVSEHTVRRRLRNGDLEGHQVSSVGGFTWIVEVPEESVPRGTDDTVTTAVMIAKMEAHIASLEAHITSLDAQLAAKDKQIEQLHVLLQQAQALPPPRGKPWWGWWRRG
jgi:excisionase family DNA binding protein